MTRTMVDPDSITVVYVADANGTTMALVQLGDVPTDGTWWVMEGDGQGWRQWTASHYVPTYMAHVLVVARPIGSDNG